MQGPHFQDISRMMQPEHVIALCSLVASVQRCSGLWRLQEVMVMKLEELHLHIVHYPATLFFFPPFIKFLVKWCSLQPLSRRALTGAYAYNVKLVSMCMLH